MNIYITMKLTWKKLYSNRHVLKHKKKTNKFKTCPSCVGVDGFEPPTLCL